MCLPWPRGHFACFASSSTAALTPTCRYWVLPFAAHPAWQHTLLCLLWSRGQPTCSAEFYCSSQYSVLPELSFKRAVCVALLRCASCRLLYSGLPGVCYLLTGSIAAVAVESAAVGQWFTWCLLSTTRFLCCCCGWGLCACQQFLRRIHRLLASKLCPLGQQQVVRLSRRTERLG